MNLKSLKKLQRLLSQFGDKIDEQTNKIEYKYRKEGNKTINYIARSVIDEFYGKYDPYYYDRWGDLYNVFKVTVNSKVWKIDYSPSFMKYKHDVSNEYIYMLSFEYGYHGGAWKGKDHPEPGVPYYRTFPTYKTWSRPAKFASFSPYTEIENRVNKYLDEVNIDMNNEFRESIFPYMKEIESQIKKTFK